MSVLVGRGNGSFRRPLRYRTERRREYPSDVAVEDLTGDGLPELVVRSAVESNGGVQRDNLVTVRLNDGIGHFDRGYAYSSRMFRDAGRVATGDFNGDGVIDVLADVFGGGDFAVLLGTGAGRLAAPRLVHGLGALWPVVGDFNDDAMSDVASVAWRSSSVVVRLAVGAGRFGPAGAVAVRDDGAFLTAADLNDDDKLDLLLGGSQGGRMRILLGNGDGTFRPRSQYSLRYPAFTNLVADFDGDRSADVATASWVIDVRRGLGDGTLAQHRSLPWAWTYTHAALAYSGAGAVADFNSDGRPDLATMAGGHELGWRPAVLLNWTGLPAPPCVVVPTTRESLRVARRHLMNAGCRVSRIRHRYSRRITKGHVISQRPKHGVVLASQAAVELTISRGRRGRQQALP